MTKHNCLIVIPARLASKRLPNKPILKIGDKSLINIMIDIAHKASEYSSIVIATDSIEIKEEVNSLGVEVIMTSRNHKNGTARVLEVMDKVNASFFINLQCDEPLLHPDDLIKLIVETKKSESDVVSICHKELNNKVNDPSSVKVVFDKNNNALYFSRSNIPFNSDFSFIHTGIYGFTKEALQKIKRLETSKLEKIENLEQLRWIENELRIKMLITNNKTKGVDTEIDLKEVKKKFNYKNFKGLITDVDGVLTKGELIYGKNGEELKVFNVQDGLAIKRILKKGIKVAICSAKSSEALKARINDLGITYYKIGSENKIKSCKELLKQMNLSSNDICYVGDDQNDIEPMQMMAYGFAVSDASEELKMAADEVLETCGGKGVFNEIFKKLFL